MTIFQVAQMGSHERSEIEQHSSIQLLAVTSKFILNPCVLVTDSVRVQLQLPIT